MREIPHDVDRPVVGDMLCLAVEFPTPAIRESSFRLIALSIGSFHNLLPPTFASRTPIQTSLRQSFATAYHKRKMAARENLDSNNIRLIWLIHGKDVFLVFLQLCGVARSLQVKLQS
jgi:hypothetical protein